MPSDPQFHDQLYTQLKHQIATHGLSAYTETIAALTKPALKLSKTDGQYLPVGASRFGGLPDLPPDFSWWRSQDQPLSFLAQLNCADLQSFPVAQVLPQAGLLSFFYDVINQPWGGDRGDRDGFAVMYTPPTTALVPAEMPTDAAIDQGWLLPTFGITFTEILSIPHYEAPELDLLQLDDTTRNHYFDLVANWLANMFEGEPCHQLFGYPQNIQGDVRLECVLAQQGFYEQPPTPIDISEIEAATQASLDWHLCLQIDSDDDLQVMWGDMGILYVCLRSLDLQAQCFDQAWTILQCG